MNKYDKKTKISPGSYSVICTGSRLIEKSRWGKPKLYISFKINNGKHNGTTLVRYYNIIEIDKTHDDTDPLLTNGPVSDYIRDCRRLFEIDKTQFKASIFHNKKFQVEVTTVKQDRSGRELGKLNYHSKINHIEKTTSAANNDECIWDQF